jgi:L-amino acid N-acyltransferase YncA
VLFDTLALEPSVHVVALHRKHGFTEVGTFREYAIKNGRYISSVWMQRNCAAAAVSS